MGFHDCLLVKPSYYFPPGTSCGCCNGSSENTGGSTTTTTPTNTNPQYPDPPATGGPYVLTFSNGVYGWEPAQQHTHEPVVPPVPADLSTTYSLSIVNGQLAWTETPVPFVLQQIEIDVPANSPVSAIADQLSEIASFNVYDTSGNDEVSDQLVIEHVAGSNDIGLQSSVARRVIIRAFGPRIFA